MHVNVKLICPTRTQAKGMIKRFKKFNVLITFRMGININRGLMEEGHQK